MGRPAASLCLLLIALLAAGPALSASGAPDAPSVVKRELIRESARLSDLGQAAARDALDRAVRGWTNAHRLWEASWARLDLAHCLMRTNRFAEAASLLASVRSTAEDLGSAPLVARADEPIDDELREKIALFCDVKVENVISEPDAWSIYGVPTMLEDVGLGRIVVEQLGLEAAAPDLAAWRTLEDRIRYTPTSAFETFPWPYPVTSDQREAVAAASRALIARRSPDGRRRVGGSAQAPPRARRGRGRRLRLAEADRAGPRRDERAPARAEPRHRGRRARVRPVRRRRELTS